MIGLKNKKRLEQEIAHLVSFITEGRELFFKLTNTSLSSTNSYINHFTIMDLFQTNQDMIQLELNIQLLYIKLSSYYYITEKNKSQSKNIKIPRNVFAHDWNDLVFNKKIKYNFMLYKVSENFKKVMYLFYNEEQKDTDKPEVKSVELNIHSDINDFLEIWNKENNHGS